MIIRAYFSVVSDLYYPYRTYQRCRKLQGIFKAAGQDGKGRPIGLPFGINAA